MYCHQFHPLLAKITSEQMKEVHDGYFNWIIDFFSVGDDFILNHYSLDSYLFLRFLKMVFVMTFVGLVTTWPILLPINVTGGGGQSGLDILSFSNVQKPDRYFVHTFVAWLFLGMKMHECHRSKFLMHLGFVMFVITVETYHYINLRHAYFLSVWNSGKISTKTVLFTSVPDGYVDIHRLKSIFQASKQIWIAVDPKDLNERITEAESIAFRLEQAEIELCKRANSKLIKAKKEKALVELGSLDHWLDKKERPTHKTACNKGGLGKMVDTIEWCRNELASQIPKIEELQKLQLNGQNQQRMPAAFIEFEDEQSAQAAYSMLNHNQPGHMIPRQIGVLPEDIVWENLHISYWQGVIRYAIASLGFGLLILFWSVPVAVIGVLSNVNYLAGNVPFLSWINNLHPVVLGIITGLLPTVTLTLLTGVVPGLCRCKSPPTVHPLFAFLITLVTEASNRFVQEVWLRYKIPYGTSNSVMVLHFSTCPCFPFDNLHFWSCFRHWSNCGQS